MRMENYESAIETYLKNLAFLKTANSNYYELLTLDQLINCLEKNSNIEEAIKYSLQMFTVSQLGNSIKGQIQSLLYQAKLYWRLNQIQKSEEILNKASKLVSEVHTLFFFKIASNLFKYFYFLKRDRVKI